MSKKSKALGLHEPLRHQDHPRPRRAGEFVAQSFMTGGASVVGPRCSVCSPHPRGAQAALAPDIQTLINPCDITTGAGIDSLHLLRSRRRRQHRRLERAGRRSRRPARFL